MGRRQEEILNAANDFAQTNDNLTIKECFEAGAAWADNNPESKYNLSNTDYIVTMIESAMEAAERTTTGNLAHNRASIILQLRLALQTCEKITNKNERRT